MHELPVAESILEITLRHAAGKQVTDIFLVLGQLSSIIDDSVAFYWGFVSQGSKAEGARLHFRRIQAEFRCLDCEHSYQPSDQDLACPACASTRVKLVKGDEFFVEAIEVENTA